MTSEMLNTAEELNAAHNDPKYYDFLVNEYGFTKDVSRKMPSL